MHSANVTSPSPVVLDPPLVLPLDVPPLELDEPGEDVLSASVDPPLLPPSELDVPGGGIVPLLVPAPVESPPSESVVGHAVNNNTEQSQRIISRSRRSGRPRS